MRLLLAVHSQLEPSASGPTTGRLALGLEIFLVGFGPEFLGSFHRTMVRDSLQEPTGPPRKATAYGCWQNTEWVGTAYYLFLCLGQVCIETTFLSKLHQPSVDSFSHIFVKFSGTVVM